MTTGATTGVVGLMSGQNPNVLVGLLGIIKSGNAFVPIDPNYPLERIELMVQDCGIEMLVTEKVYTEQARRLAAQSTKLQHVIYIEDLSHESAVAPTDTPEGQGRGAVDPARDPDQTLYIIYTSGSTGRPKGVPISHRNIIPLLRWSKEYFNFGKHTGVLQNLSHCFDFGVFELLTSVLFGGTLYFLDRQNISDITDYTKLIRDHAINTIHSTPSFFREMLLPGGGLESVKVVHLGGEALTGELVDAIFAAVGDDCVVYNGYGPTEASVNCAIFRIDCAEHQRAPHSSIPIGRATANNTLYILDQHATPTPIGVPGELYVGGAGLARGYLNRPELTAERFVPNPFRKDEGGRMKDETGAFILHPSSLRLYKTGDLARYRPDGNIEFLGRLDHQVKLRGFRIELGEIESSLRQHPSVRDAVVMAREDRPGDQRLVAYVVTSSKASSLVTPNSSLAAELRSFLAERLPAYMLPAAFVVLEAMPLTPNGKLDRRALPAPDPAGSRLEEGFVGPRTPIEEAVAEIWRDVLQFERVDIHDNFFELGGHSLLATQVVARVRETFQVELPLSRLFKQPTVAGLAEEVIQSRREQQAGLPQTTSEINQSVTPLLLANLDRLSDADVEALLQEMLTGEGVAA